MRTQQLTITFPKKKVDLKADLLKLKEEDSLNISSFVVSCIEKQLGAYV
tara:strand:+ start:194 stop:340 length:147 start_codon:yes stop_codon:yes gene_type:complete